MATEAPFLILNDLGSINRLIADGIEEGINLDYKASPSLTRDSGPTNEMCKDVSAFANSAGGQIIYGVAERSDHEKADIG